MRSVAVIDLIKKQKSFDSFSIMQQLSMLDAERIILLKKYSAVTGKISHAELLLHVGDGDYRFFDRGRDEALRRFIEVSMSESSLILDSIRYLDVAISEKRAEYLQCKLVIERADEKRSESIASSLRENLKKEDEALGELFLVSSYGDV